MNHKNSAYQRGASRQQPQPQPTAPSVAAAPAQKSLPGWLWLACGMIIGTCTVFLMNLNSGGEADKAPEATVAPAGSAETAPAQIATQVDEPHKPKYDFYTLLPDSKVILPPNMEEETVATPAPAAVPSEADRAEAALAAGAAAAAAAALASKATDTAASQTQNAVALKPAAPAVTVTTNTQPKQPPAPPVVKPTPVAKVTPPPVPSTPVAKVAPSPVQPTVTPPPTQAKLQSPPPAAPAPAKPQQLFLQAGSYRSADDADRMRAEMLLMGVNARIEKSQVRGETWHRVLVGPYSNQDKMNQARKQLSENGFSSLIPQRR